MAAGEDSAPRIVIAALVPDQVHALATSLESYGYEAALCLPDEWASHIDIRPAAIVVGPGLSPRETWQCCKEIRAATEAPLVVLAPSAEPDHVSLALDSGADYCFTLVPDVAARTVLAAIHAVERREHMSRRPTKEIIQAGHLRIDLLRKTVVLHGKRLQLTTTEFGILSVLAQHPGQVVSAGDILRQVQGYDADDAAAQDIVKVHVSRLRQKIEAPDDPPCLINVRGQGYTYMFERRLTPPS